MTKTQSQTTSEPTLERLQQRIAEIENRLNESDDHADWSPGRRTVLSLLGIGTLIGVAQGARAAPNGVSIECVWRGNQSANGNGLYDLKELHGGISGDQTITTINGSGLTINSGELEASSTGGGDDAQLARRNI